MTICPYTVFKKMYPDLTLSFNDEVGLFAVPDRHFWAIKKLFTHGLSIWKGGRGSAKTHSAVLGFLQKCATEKYNLLLVRREYVLTKKTIFAYFVDIIKKSEYLSSIFTYTADTITCTVTDSKITAMGVVSAGRNTVDKIKGVPDLNAVWFDEIVTTLDGNEIDPETYSEVLNTIGRGEGEKGVCLISFNPISVNKWVYKKYFNPETVNPADLVDTYIFETTYKDNPFISKDFISRIENLRLTDPLQWEMVANGKWGVIRRDSPFVIGFKDTQIKPIEYNPHLYTFYCIDFNYHNPVVLVIQADSIYKPSVVSIVDEIWQKEGFIEDLAKVVRDRYFDPSARVVPDMTGFAKNMAQKEGTAIDQFIRTVGLRSESVLCRRPTYNGNMRYLSSNLEHQVSHRVTNFAFNTAEITIDPKCTNLIFDLNDTEWVIDKNGKGVMTKGAGNEKNNRNALDCLRYFCQSAFFDASKHKQDLLIET